MDYIKVETGYDIQINPEIVIHKAYSVLNNKYPEYFTNIIKYLYLVNDYRSAYFKWSISERKKKAQEDTNIPLSVLKSKVFKDAEKLYIDLQKSPVLDALNSYTEMIYTIMEASTTVSSLLKARLNEVKKISDKEKKTTEDLALIASIDISGTIDLIQKASKIGGDLPKIIESLQKVKAKLETEKEDTKGRGDQEIGVLNTDLDFDSI